MKYNTENETLIRSDLEELRGEPEPKSIEDGSQKALIVEFSLPSSSYATMALREILKCDTSVANQMQLQQATAPNEAAAKQAIDDTEFPVIDAKQPRLDISEQ